jgi:hypothetical protein
MGRPCAPPPRRSCPCLLEAQDAADAQKVVRGGDQIGAGPGLRAAAVPSISQATDRLIHPKISSTRVGSPI